LKRATRSLLEELNSISEKKNGEAVIEARATHVIDSAINLLSLIKENFNPEEHEFYNLYYDQLMRLLPES
jgi:hypothetical protein